MIGWCRGRVDGEGASAPSGVEKQRAAQKDRPQYRKCCWGLDDRATPEGGATIKPYTDSRGGASSELTMRFYHSEAFSDGGC